MNVVIFAVGKPKTNFFDLAIAEYQKRLSRWVKLQWRFFPTSNKAEETKQLLASLPTDAYVILLDERGVQRSTPELAQHLEKLQNQATKNLIFIIGGAHGVDDSLMKRVDFTWSLSKLVFPHEQVRLMLGEQLYRAYDINANGSYHHL
jgi:23S rRNA (pseudouridine1915-N3)-methyltransferase